MSKNKILLSVGTLVVAVAIVAGGTIAFYNDTETSAGNIFTAGSIDLKVDHLKQTYNGVDCETCNVTIVSDTTNIVTAKNGVPIATTPAVAVTQIPGAWTASIPGATWIWATDQVLPEDATTDVTYTFEKSFDWNGPIPSATITFSVAADNHYEVYVNNHLVAADVNDNNFAVADTLSPALITPWLISGANTIKFVVKNKDDQENSLLETETEAGDAAGQGNPLGFGELSSFINVFTWSDTDGDGQYDTGESSLGSVGPLSSLASIMSMDSQNHEYLTATTTKNIGLAWCAGTLTPNQGGAFSCNGAGMLNTAQSDSFSANLTAYAEQVRNNGAFQCSGVTLQPI